MKQFLLITFMCMFCSLSSRPQVSRSAKGSVMSEEKYNAVINFLRADSSQLLKDTIIIKYDFKFDNCWSMLDGMDKDYILRVITSSENRVSKALLSRPGISVFQFREKADATGRYKKLNNNIRIDEGFLKKTLFTKRTTCGTSAIILPDRRYVIVKSDSHFDALFSTGDLIAKAFK